MSLWLIILLVFSFGFKVSTATNQYPISMVNDDWDLNQPFTTNTTANLIFSTATSLLQSAPNLQYRNGHTIIPGIVSSGTLLYHGRGDSIIPTTEWVAFEPEVSQSFCRLFSKGNNSCWLHTFAAVRPLRVLYFDGASAAKIGEGTMDSQDIITWGEIRPDLAPEEGLRIKTLCQWGKTFGLDGFVRLASLSEIMLCNFTSVNHVSSQNLRSSPFKTAADPSPTVKPVSVNADVSVFLRGLERLNHYPGLTHVQLDFSHLVSFYDQDLAPSLIGSRSGKPRMEHRLLGIAGEDIVRAKRYLEEQISETQWDSLNDAENRIDWASHLHSIVDIYGETLEDIRNLVNSTVSPTQSATHLMKDVFWLIESLVQRFVLHSVSPPRRNSSFGFGRSDSDLAWASSVFRECTLAHNTITSSLSLTKSEKLLRDAVEGTTRELCRILTKMWTGGVYGGLSEMFDDMVFSEDSHSESEEATALLNIWKADVEKLMEWLDWGVWVRCRPACKEQEVCYLPAWPFVVGVAGPVWRGDNPSPRCLRKLAPFTYTDESSGV